MRLQAEGTKVTLEMHEDAGKRNQSETASEGDRADTGGKGDIAKVLQSSMLI